MVSTQNSLWGIYGKVMLNYRFFFFFKWTLVLSGFAWSSDQYQNTQNPGSQCTTSQFNKYKKPVSKDLHLWNTMKQKLNRKTCTAAGKTQDKHLNPLHWPQNPHLLKTKAALSPRAKLNLQSSLQSHPAGTSTSLLDLHCAQQAELQKPRKTFIWSFIYLWTSTSTWQLQVLCVQHC